MTSCGLYIAWITHHQMKRMAALSHIFPTMTLWYSTSKDLTTIFAWSDTAATIYFIAQFCAASIREQLLIERRLLKSVLSVKSYVIVRALRKASCIKSRRFTMWWLGCEANLPTWSAAALLQSGTYTVPPINFLVFFQLFHTMIALHAWKNAKHL